MSPAAAGVGARAAGLEAAWELVRARGAAAQLYISQGGKVLLHRGMRCRRDALFWTFSASKPVISVLTYILAERSAIDLDSPIAHYWPAFAGHGKAHLTARHVLRHRTGMPLAGSAVGDALTMPSWRAEIARIERARPRLDPADGPAYQWVIYGFILGELAQRVTKQGLPQLLRRELTGPLAMDATFLGVPRELLARCVPLRGVSAGERLGAPFLNSARVRRAVIPSAGLSTTAASLARLYEALIQVRGRSPISRESLAEATLPTWLGQIDQFLKLPTKWGQGFQLGGSLARDRTEDPTGAARHLPGPSGAARQLPDSAGPAPSHQPTIARSTRDAATLAAAAAALLPRVRPTPADAARWVSAFGSLSSERTFGHNGSNCCIAWADPDRELVFIYLTDRWSIDAHAHLTQVSDAALTAV